MKLIIQIPCYNEAETLLQTIQGLPSKVAGFNEVEFLVIDDGSTDDTAEIAKSLGVQHLRQFSRNRGLARAFAAGLETALELGADVIVNTDGDNQYSGECVEDIVRPILAGEADMVVGDRQVSSIAHFSRTKRLLQRLGSWVVRRASGTSVPDATSGFRALSREAAMRIEIFSDYTYTLETIIQAGKKGLTVTSAPVEVNPQTRASRLIGSVPSYIFRSAGTIVRIFLMYEPLRVFSILSLLPFLMGLALVIRFGYFYAIGEGGGHIQSLIIAAILLILSFLIFLLGLMADLIARNRQLSEEIRYQQKKMVYQANDHRSVHSHHL